MIETVSLSETMKNFELRNSFVYNCPNSDFDQLLTIERLLFCPLISSCGKHQRGENISVQSLQILYVLHNAWRKLKLAHIRKTSLTLQGYYFAPKLSNLLILRFSFLMWL